MASQSFNLIGQEEEQELVAFDTRQSRGPTPQSLPNSRMEMLSQLIKSQDAIAKSQDATAKLLENRIVDSVRVQAEANTSLETKVSELAKSQSELHTSTDDMLSQIAYKQIEQIAEMSDLVDRISTVERSLQGSPYTGSDPTRRSPTPPRNALIASAPYTLALDLVTCPGEFQNGKIVQSTTADSCPFTQKPTLRDETNPSLYRTDSRFLNSPVEEEVEEEVGFRPLKVIGRPIDKGSVNTTQGQRWGVLEVGENLGQERIIESHTVGPEVQ